MQVIVTSLSAEVSGCQCHRQSRAFQLLEQHANGTSRLTRYNFPLVCYSNLRKNHSCRVSSRQIQLTVIPNKKNNNKNNVTKYEVSHLRYVTAKTLIQLSPQVESPCNIVKTWKQLFKLPVTENFNSVCMCSRNPSTVQARPGGQVQAIDHGRKRQIQGDHSPAISPTLQLSYPLCVTHFKQNLPVLYNMSHCKNIQNDLISSKNSL